MHTAALPRKLPPASFRDSAPALSVGALETRMGCSSVAGSSPSETAFTANGSVPSYVTHEKQATPPLAGALRVPPRVPSPAANLSSTIGLPSVTRLPSSSTT